MQIGADGVAAIVGIGRIARLADGIHRLKLLHIEIGVFPDTCHTSTLLVNTEQGRTIQSTYL